MHDDYMDSMTIKVEHPYSDVHREDQFGDGHLVGIVGDHSPNLSPHSEYNGLGFLPPGHMSVDPMYSRPPPAYYSPPQPLHPINTATLWPSQITNPSETVPIVAVAMHRPIAPLSRGSPAPTPAPVASSGPTMSSSRRTLTDNDRRRMCKYHEENPNVKQTEIGLMFGVERSTVSKVLRNKEKYLIAEDGNKEPIKRSKSKFPDIERCLAQWTKNRLDHGLPLDDDSIRDQARKFVSTVGSLECSIKVSDPFWLEKFKQRNKLPGAKSPAIKDEIAGKSPGSESGSQTPTGLSPTISWDAVPRNPPTQFLEDPKCKSPDDFFCLSDNGNNYGHSHSQSTASLRSCFSDNTISSPFSSDFRSPASPFFSPMSSSDPSPSMPATKFPCLPPLAPAGSLRRRQTVPLVGAQSPVESTAAKTLRMESQMEDMEASPATTDSAMQPPRPNNTSENSSLTMVAPSTISPSIGSHLSGFAPLSSSPSHDEARAALETLITFVQHQPHSSVDAHDYIVMNKLMKIVNMETGGLPGGMHSIPMNERADGTLPIGRKRSEHSLS